MSHDAPQNAPAAQGRIERTQISCPGCGRHDYVPWPAGQAVLHWICFNCRGSFELRRETGH